MNLFSKVLKIEIYTPDYYSMGSGFMAAPGMVVTAAHVIEDIGFEMDDPVISISHHSNSIDTHYASFSDVIFNGYPEFDVAIIKIDPSFRVESIPLLSRSITRKVEFLSCGYPFFNRGEDDFEPKPFSGSVCGQIDEAVFNSVLVDSEPEFKEYWAGASGSPVVVDGYAVGVIFHGSDETKNELGYISVKKIYESSEEFKEFYDGQYKNSQLLKFDVFFKKSLVRSISYIDSGFLEYFESEYLFFPEGLAERMEKSDLSPSMFDDLMLKLNKCLNSDDYLVKQLSKRDLSSLKRFAQWLIVGTLDEANKRTVLEREFYHNGRGFEFVTYAPYVEVPIAIQQSRSPDYSINESEGSKGGRHISSSGTIISSPNWVFDKNTTESGLAEEIYGKVVERFESMPQNYPVEKAIADIRIHLKASSGEEGDGFLYMCIDESGRAELEGQRWFHEMRDKLTPWIRFLFLKNNERGDCEQSKHIVRIMQILTMIEERMKI